MISEFQKDAAWKLLREMQLLEPDVAEHGRRVQLISLCIAEKTCLTAKEISDLSTAAAFHDIGKMLITIEPYTVFEEFEMWEIRRHTLLGFLLLKNRGFSTSISEVALYHHEWFDGSGYPFGLKGQDIPLLARICAVADAYEVMITGRPYQRSIKVADALYEIKYHSGSQFDPAIVNILLQYPPQLP
jgi:HD-GYP domain-containing protein (c-di-GMP phosphodiesterase class II)